MSVMTSISSWVQPPTIEMDGWKEGQIDHSIDINVSIKIKLWPGFQLNIGLKANIYWDKWQQFLKFNSKCQWWHHAVLEWQALIIEEGQADNGAFTEKQSICQLE